MNSLQEILANVYDGILDMIETILPVLGLVILAGVSIWGLLLAIRMIKECLLVVTGHEYDKVDFEEYEDEMRQKADMYANTTLESIDEYEKYYDDDSTEDYYE